MSRIVVGTVGGPAGYIGVYPNDRLLSISAVLVPQPYGKRTPSRANMVKNIKLCDDYAALYKRWDHHLFRVFDGHPLEYIFARAAMINGGFHDEVVGRLEKLCVQYDVPLIAGQRGDRYARDLMPIMLFSLCRTNIKVRFKPR